MKLSILMVFITINLIGQKPTYIDSVYIQYTKQGNIHYFTKMEPDEFLLNVSPYLRILTDESLNKSLSDSLSIIYNKRKQKSSKIIEKLEHSRNSIALDSSTNVLSIRIQTHNCNCLDYLHQTISSSEEISGLLKNRKCKSIIVNYIQIEGSSSSSIVFVTLGFRFNKVKNYSIVLPL